jgi:hypothetical protein
MQAIEIEWEDPAEGEYGGSFAMVPDPKDEELSLAVDPPPWGSKPGPFTTWQWVISGFRSDKNIADYLAVGHEASREDAKAAATAAAEVILAAGR